MSTDGDNDRRQTKVMDPLLEALDKLGRGSNFLWTIFIFTLTPMVFNGMHSMSYIFIADVPKHWCAIPSLTGAIWTDEEIRNISSSSPCTMYNYNYENFAQIGFEKALEYKISNPLPESIFCDVRDFANNNDGTSLVQDWDLVCDKSAARSSTHMALSLGKLLGSAFFGIFADKYGRKICCVIGTIMLITSGPAGAIVPWYWGFMISRLINGASHAAILYSAFTTLTEVANEKHRQWMGIAYNIGYALGMVIVSGVAYLLHEWRHIQLAISLPALLLLIQLWLMPESPRWLIAHNRRDEAKSLINKASKASPDITMTTSIASNIEEKEEEETKQESKNIKERLHEDIKGFWVVISNSELRKRLLITNFTWMTASLTYYALALNVNNFSTNRYIYVSVMGLTEIPAYLIPTPILMVMGRRTGSGSLYIIAALCLLSILAIPTTDSDTIMIVSLIGRFSASAAYGIAILYSSELFPTVCRNSAVGTNSAMSHVGSVAAPYVADLLGAAVWWGPTTLCGGLALIAGLLCLVLPETRGRPLANTVDEEITEERDNVSFYNGYKCVKDVVLCVRSGRKSQLTSAIIS
ncbi:organic cation transporter protein [Frieseomelitta varia]|uniref:organic cation transporter protein n=1 Tax=Frieseomelitta varia TaxID=561572 RepID=UPI001CB6B099|nr:organic cation transporter protein [Frieseomelitta varia]XP_043523374.1 organic cation transporter protein [Frieseomelitta varia]XP_043523383.1 organic cation transporter protein [Frieseomelitta varia]